MEICKQDDDGVVEGTYILGGDGLVEETYILGGGVEMDRHALVEEEMNNDNLQSFQKLS